MGWHFERAHASASCGPWKANLVAPQSLGKHLKDPESQQFVLSCKTWYYAQIKRTDGQFCKKNGRLRCDRHQQHLWKSFGESSFPTGFAIPGLSMCCISVGVEVLSDLFNLLKVLFRHRANDYLLAVFGQMQELVT